jgi:hypothetical protein
MAPFLGATDMRAIVSEAARDACRGRGSFLAGITVVDRRNGEGIAMSCTKSGRSRVVCGDAKHGRIFIDGFVSGPRF